MKAKLRPKEKKVLLYYAVFFAIILLFNIYLAYSIEQFESTDWNYLIFIKTLLFTIPTSILITLFFTSLLLIPPNERISNKNISKSKRRKGLFLGFLLGFIINFTLLISAVHIVAKMYNVYGPSQKEILVEGRIMKVYTKNKIKKRNNRKYYVTIEVLPLQKEIVIISKKKYTVNDLYKETLTLGSLGFLYKK